MNRSALIFAGLALALTLSGCTSSTRSTVNKVQATEPSVSKTLMADSNLSLKRLVAISRFSDETKRSNSFLVDKKGNRLGKQASDILSTRLSETQKFIMLERQEMGSLKAEKGELFERVGANFLIVGSVSEFGRANNSEVGIFSRNKIQTATATVNVRLIDTRSGQIVYSEEATGEARSEANRVFGVGETAGYDSSLDDKAISAAISKLVSNIVENLMDSPWQAYLVGAQEGFLMMTGGAEQGIKIGDEFSVLTKGKSVKNPQTGMSIELPGENVATIRINSFLGKGANALSLCEVISGAVDESSLSDLVVRELDKE